ncbi:MAG: lipocalin family protein [Chitinophagales bacterium]|nr:lipocalin family protein [Chitinophagales bacterium]
MNKLFFGIIALLLLATSCTKDQLIKQLKGTYKVNSYIKDNKDETNSFKAEKQDYRLEIQESNTFIESYNLNGQVYQQTTGQWQLINSNKDLQLVDASNNVRMFNIKAIADKTMTLTKGNEEYKFIE